MEGDDLNQGADADPIDNGGGADFDDFNPDDFDDSGIESGADDSAINDTGGNAGANDPAKNTDSARAADKSTDVSQVATPEPALTVNQLDSYLTELSGAYRNGIKSLADKYENGEFTHSEYEEAKLDLKNEFDQKQDAAKNERQRIVGNQEAVAKAWETDVQAFLKEQPDYESPILQGALSAALQAVAKTDAAKGLSNSKLLALAHELAEKDIQKAAAGLLQRNRAARQKNAVGLPSMNANASKSDDRTQKEQIFDFYRK